MSRNRRNVDKFNKNESGKSTDSDPSLAEERYRKFVKTSEDHEFIEEILKNSMMFQDIPHNSPLMAEVINAFDAITYDKGHVIFQQNDRNTEYMYIVDSGAVSVAIGGNVLPEPYGTLKRGSIFGENSFLYDKSRSATISVTETTKLFRLHRYYFDKFFKELQDSGTTDKELKGAVEKLQKIDDVIDVISGVKTKYSGDVLMPYSPFRFWLYRQWKGTVIQHAWKLSVYYMLLTTGIVAAVQISVVRDEKIWSVLQVPDKKHPFIQGVLGLNTFWSYLLTLTTFILVFFLSIAFRFWRNFYDLTRSIQGRMNDIGLLLISVAKRETGCVNNEGVDTSGYHPGTDVLLEKLAHYLRLFHVFFWAGETERFGVLLSKEGMNRMISRSLLTKGEYAILQSCAGQTPMVILEWMIISVSKGFSDGILVDGPGSPTRQLIVDKIVALRVLSLTINDELAGRMPLAYVNLVQWLVDVLLVFAPFALFSEGGFWAIPCVGIITLFFSGLLDLAKLFLDPLSNDNYMKDSVNIDIGSLIRESNASSTLWKRGAMSLPFDFHEQFGSSSCETGINQNRNFDIETVGTMDIESVGTMNDGVLSC